MINLEYCGDETRWLAMSRAVEKQYRFCHKTAWLTSKTDPGLPPSPLEVMIYDTGYGMSAIEWPDEAVIRLTRNSFGEITAEIYAANMGMLYTVECLLKIWLPVLESSESDLMVAFWSYSPNGPRLYHRTLLASSWDDIKVNYTASTRDSLTALHDMRLNTESGKLILWTGTPGTGKSYALRGLAHSWRNWCRIHYILDPEHFFGDHSDYLLQVLLGEDVGLLQLAPLGASHVANPQWRLIVLEDTGELISADAKTRSGQGLSRLLNTADGLIGQGLRILVLITTNEELEHLHKAVLRPGRCLANAKFGALSQKEARGWLDMHGLHGVEPVKAVLSDLYAILNEKNVIGQCSDQRKVVGF